MNLKRAAQALVECKFANECWTRHDNWYVKTDTHTEKVDPFNNEAQRQALLEWYRIGVWRSGEEWASQAEFHKSAGYQARTRYGKTRIEAENAVLEEILK